MIWNLLRFITAVSQQSLLKLWNLRSSFSWQAMREKYLKGVFGTCPRVLCDRHGLRVVYFPDILGNGKVSLLHISEACTFMSSRIATAPHLYVKRPIEERENGSWAEVGLIGDCINGINITSNFYAWFVGLGILHLPFTPSLSKHAEHLTAVGCKFRQKAVLHVFLPLPRTAHAPHGSGWRSPSCAG